MRPKNFVAPEFGEPIRANGPDGEFWAFLPKPIPRRIDLEPATIVANSRADIALANLAGAGRLLPNPHLLAQSYVVREAVASSGIEGTQASVPDVFDSTSRGTEQGDVKEVRNYVRAFNQGLRRLDELPLCVRMITEIHAVLMEGVRGEDRRPGQIRETQNWIGSGDDRPQTAVFVPPPHTTLADALSDWEQFAHDDQVELPALVRCALLHYQFETIHPFLDGNGRVGRLLIVFYLVSQSLLPQPLLYVSAYFENHKAEYYERLQMVRERGDIQSWLRFFMRAVEVQSRDALERAERLMDLRERYREIANRTRSRSHEVIDLLFENPIVRARNIAEALSMTPEGAKNLIRELERGGVLVELPGSGGSARRWVAHEVLEVVT